MNAYQSVSIDYRSQRIVERFAHKMLSEFTPEVEDSLAESLFVAASELGYGQDFDAVGEAYFKISGVKVIA